MSEEQDAFVQTMMRFCGQCDDTEKAMLYITLDRLTKAKSKGAQTRCLNEFGDWYRANRGLPPVTPQRGKRA